MPKYEKKIIEIVLVVPQKKSSNFSSKPTSEIPLVLGGTMKQTGTKGSSS